MKKFLLASAFALVASVSAQATPIINSTTGIASPATTIFFDEVAVAQDALVTNQFAGLGLTLIGSAWYSPQTGFPNIEGADIANFTYGGGFSSAPLTLQFSVARTSAAFAMVSNSSSYRFEALLGNAVVEDFEAAVGIGSDNFYGFEGFGFDAIRVTSLASDYYIIDAVQMGRAAPVGVPEPATWALLIGGFGLAGVSLRRRKALAA